MALSQEFAERNVMKRPPRSPSEKLFDRSMILNILWVGIVIGVTSLISGFVTYRADSETWRTMVFTTLTMAQMGQALVVRSERDLLLEIGIFSNKQLIGAVLLTVVLQMGVIYLPFMQAIFETTALSFGNLVLSIALGAVVFIIGEITKLVVRKLRKGK